MHNKSYSWKSGINLNPFPQWSVISMVVAANPGSQASCFSKEGQRDEEHGEPGVIFTFPWLYFQ